jgi:hypothetical protein
MRTNDNTGLIGTRHAAHTGCGPVSGHRRHCRRGGTVKDVPEGRLVGRTTGCGCRPAGTTPLLNRTERNVMPFVPFHSIIRLDNDTARVPPASHSPKVARKPSPPRKGPAAAWAAWTADGAPSSGLEFIESISSWTQGTAAQLLRPRWPPVVERPTAHEVQQRLCHHLGVLARGGQSAYLDALEQARRAVIEELREARSA